MNTCSLMLRMRESDKGGDMKSSRTILTVLVFLMVVVVALAFSPKAMADTVLSESADDWSFVLQPNASGDMMRFNFYGRLKPAYKYKDIKDWNGSGAANTDFTMPEFITYFGEEKMVVILPSVFMLLALMWTMCRPPPSPLALAL